MRIFNIGVFVVFMAGCVTTGNKFDLRSASQLRAGVSTVTEAVQLMGPPTAYSAIGNDTLLQWQYSRGSLAGGSGAHLAVLFDKSGHMIRVTHAVAINN